MNGTVIQLVMESDAFSYEDERVAQLLEFLIAGHDTTAFSIAWILLSLARNPEEQSKLRESLGENWNASEQLKRVVKEGMRLHPVTSNVGIRVIGRDITTCVFNATIMQERILKKSRDLC